MNHNGFGQPSYISAAGFFTIGDRRNDDCRSCWDEKQMTLGARDYQAENGALDNESTRTILVSNLIENNPIVDYGWPTNLLKPSIWPTVYR
ncbi:hypothetical protein TSAR_005545, partial [Trichomalopsis sarcophagae]